MELQTKWFAETIPQNAKAASTTIGGGTDGTVTITCDDVGEEGNSYTKTVVATTTVQDRALSASIDGTDITVTLATEGNAKAQTTIGSGGDGTVTVEVDAAGTNGNSYTIEVVVGTELAAELTDTALVVTLAAAGNTATEIAGIINSSEGDTFTATASGTGASSITEAVAEKSFAGGSNQLKASANTATLVAAAVDDLMGVTATASGTGATALTAAVSKTAFTGGKYCSVSPIGDVWLYISNTYYYCSEPCGKYDTDAWKSVAFTTI